MNNELEKAGGDPEDETELDARNWHEWVRARERSGPVDPEALRDGVHHVKLLLELLEIQREVERNLRLRIKALTAPPDKPCSKCGR
jgi:hypothetical protein